MAAKPSNASPPAPTDAAEPAPAAGTPPAPDGSSATGTPTRNRRNPRLAAAGVLLLTAGGLTGGYLFTQAGQTETVLVLKAPITAGQRITAGQVGTAQMAVDPAVEMISSTEIDTIIGEYATASLPAGTLLSHQNVQRDLFPPAGKSVVGVALKPSQVPARGLLPGDSVHLVVTAASGTVTPGEGERIGTTWAAKVLASGDRSDDGSTTVDFILDTGASINLAAAAGAGNIAVILDHQKG